MSEPIDPLWDPGQPGDADLRRLETLLAGYRYVPGTVAPRKRAAPAARRRMRPLVWSTAAALAVGAVGLAAWLQWRLHWDEGAAWRVEADSSAAPGSLAVGGRLESSPLRPLRLHAARIGTIDLLPGARLRLTDTRTGRHRIDLERGGIRARIWAPPGQFGVTAGASEAVDLGCEFEMRRGDDGGGTIAVTSGWVMHTVGGQETLVPADSTLTFDAVRSGIPIDRRAAVALRDAVTRLDEAMARGERPAGLEDEVARAATASDTITLLVLLTRHPALASGAVYPRLAARLGVEAIDPSHRSRWQRGDADAIGAWWDRIPRPPKAWWRNWRDALPRGG